MSSRTESQFFDAVFTHRIPSLDPEDMLAGRILSSAESISSDHQPGDVHSWVEENFRLFLFLIEDLDGFDQDLLPSYFVLHKSQLSLGIVTGSGQSNCSKRIRLAVDRLSRVVFGQEPYPTEPHPLTVMPDYFHDPECLGQFRIDVTAPGFDKLFTPSYQPTSHTPLDN